MTDAPVAPPIAVLDYGIGNLRSAEKALLHAGAAARLVADPREVRGAAGVVLPGVGAFGPCASALASSGLEEAARRAIGSGVPFLGICVGFQLLYEGSEEAPGVAGLGVLLGTVRRLSSKVKVPQMQWNVLSRRVGSGPAAPGAVPTNAPGAAPTNAPGAAPTNAPGAAPGAGLLAGLEERPWVYFVHSFAPEVGDATVATCDYGGEVAAAAERDNVWGTQFHPEKSGRAGLTVLGNFVARCAAAA